MSQQGNQDAQDKRRTQYLLTPRSKWKMLQNYWKFQNRNVQIFGYVYQNTNGRNHGPVWKIQSFLLNEICTVIRKQDSCGKGNSMKFFFVYREKGLFLSVVCVDDIQMAGRKQNQDPIWKLLMKDVDLGETTSFPWTCLFGLHSTRMQNKQRYCGQLQKYVWIQNVRCGGIEKYLNQRNRKQTFPHGPMTWKVMQRNAVERYCELANKTTQQLYKSRNSMYWRSSIQRRRNRICWRIVKYMLSNCSEMSVFGSSWWTWYLVVCEQACACYHKMNQSLRQTLASFDFFHSITHENLSNIVMCNAGWDCFRTPILQEILRIQNLHQVEHCAFWEVIHLFEEVGCARNKRQCLTALQNQRSFLWMRGLRLEGLPALDLWDLIVSVLGSTIQTPERPERPVVCRSANGWNSRSRSLGFSNRSMSFLTTPNQQN